MKELLQPPYQIAAQNSWVRGVGAYTGEVAPELLADLGITWVILGHSERRAIMGESNELVRRPVTKGRHLYILAPWTRIQHNTLSDDMWLGGWTFFD